MKAAGVVRKIDDLGRLVIPKEIRKVNGWEAGTPMEFFVSNDGMVVREFVAFDEEKEAIKEGLVYAIDHTDNPAVKEMLERALVHLKNN
ncbi:AbrB/MazE/SpoVT family DNA-binding domain-containing protein [Halalkalibacterium halodurans]|uniref:SpoVT-AbrB domain-containing protein n=1 Tax=Halalkalibacterium halodurans TaxID=86665 RepID=A0A0M0KI50_ALKHA|nr:AbrB/MazE/SpoVT family DNA-binding domain-containing protein [Halalkalibacterium halodurans]TPE68002.1 AbrB/MazE/SpoVT family DNA-binding domain-containing protein [Halalkalibacterium halodurans]